MLLAGSPVSSTFSKHFAFDFRSWLVQRLPTGSNGAGYGLTREKLYVAADEDRPHL